MEIELKYQIPDEKTAGEIWNDELFLDNEEQDSRETVCFEAKYFDTEDFALASRRIAYRIRKEDDRWIAALKSKGEIEGALHRRLEINIPVDNDEPDPSVFRECELGDEIMDILDGREVSCILRTEFTRQRFRIDTGTGIFELSMDRGEIVTDNGTAPIFEVEIELFSGEEEELLQLGEVLKDKYGLETESRSKYSRGLELLGASMGELPEE